VSLVTEVISTGSFLTTVVASGAVPIALSFYAMFGLLFMAIDFFTRAVSTTYPILWRKELTSMLIFWIQSIVASLTPTVGRLEADAFADLRAFSTYSDDERNIVCNYGSPPTYGYGSVSGKNFLPCVQVYLVGVLIMSCETELSLK
jgi:hypothetical protein